MAYASFRELLAAAHKHGTLGRAALAREAEETGTSPAAVMERMGASLAVMEGAIAEGLADTSRSRSGLVGGDAALLVSATPRVVDAATRDAIVAAIAVAEVNARMGRIVAAPTGGASGVVPGVLTVVARRVEADRDETVLALLAAAALGGVIAARAFLSGAAGGCQAEIGSAAAMAALGATELAGGSPRAAGNAAAFALQGQLGLVCDPVGGLVEVPCVARNATGTAVALVAVELALAGACFPIPLDEVVDAMSHVGRSLPPSLRETAVGGLAGTPTARALAAQPDRPADRCTEA